MTPIGTPLRAWEEDEWFVDTYGQSQSIGTVSALSNDKALPKGWKPPKREFPIGFHVSAPGPSYEEVDPEPAPKPRAKPQVKP
jgi:hypothetical protein